MSAAPGTKFGSYEIVSAIGAGGMGEVYRGRDVKLGRDVAIKILPEHFANDAERVARFEREAKTLATLNHPHIAQVYGFESNALVMELVEGEDLSERIKRGPIGIDDALAIAKQIADALDAAHGQGIVHRDLKPANIKIKDDGTVKVLDFGLAKAVDPVAGSREPGTGATITSPAMTMHGVILGTAAYMSPEQAKGRPVDKRADIWAFGCIVYEMLTGQRAFPGEDVSESIASVLKTEPDLSRVPARVKPLIVSCLQKDPRKRLRDIGDAWGLIGDSDAPPAAADAGRWSHRVLPWSVATAATIAAIVVSITHFNETPPTAHTVRFQIQAPVEAGMAIPAVSPDGLRLAYRAGGQIWVRDLAGLETRAVAPIDQPVGRVFWTADSRFVVYGSAGRLMQVASTGGEPQTVGELQSGVLGGGVALPDGGMIVGQAQADTIRIGGTGQRPLPRNLGSTWMRGGVSLLPDGKRIVYSVFPPEPNPGIYVAPVDGATEPQRVFQDPAGVAYVAAQDDARSGYLLLRRQTTLVAQPVDTATLQPQGDPIELVRDVESFSASPNGTIVYRTGQGGRLTWYDRQGAVTGTAWSQGQYTELALSPDGRRVAVVRGDGPPSVWIHEFASESSVRLVPDGVTLKPLWSPGGDRVLFVKGTAGVSVRVDLVSMAPDGRGAEQHVLGAPSVVYPNSWSRDGQWLMHTRIDPRTREDLWVLPMTSDGTRMPEPFLVTDNRESDAVFAPDGRAVAYVSDESGASNVYVRAFPSSAGRKWQVSTAGGFQPRWRGDGKELFYMSAEGRLMSVDVAAGLSAAPGSPKTLFATTVFGGGATLNNWYWDVTADGQRFLVNAVSGRAEASMLNVILNWQPGAGPAQ